MKYNKAIPYGDKGRYKGKEDIFFMFCSSHSRKNKIEILFQILQIA